MTAKKNNTTTAARKPANTGKGNGKPAPVVPAADAADKVASTPTPAPAPVVVSVVDAVTMLAPPASTPAASTPPAPAVPAGPKPAAVWAAYAAGTVPPPPAAAAMLHVLYAMGATTPAAAVSKGKCMAAGKPHGVTHKGYGEGVTAGYLNVAYAGAGGLRLFSLSDKGVAWVGANPPAVPIVLATPTPAAVPALPPVQGPVTADGTPPAAAVPATAG